MNKDGYDYFGKLEAKVQFCADAVSDMRTWMKNVPPEDFTFGMEWLYRMTAALVKTQERLLRAREMFYRTLINKGHVFSEDEKDFFFAELIGRV